MQLEAEPGRQVEISIQPVILVAGDVAGVAANDPAGVADKAVPDRRAAPVLGGGAFHLIGSGGSTPQEVLGEGGHGVSPN